MSAEPVKVEAATEDIAECVEYEFSMENPGGVLRAHPETTSLRVASVYWYIDNDQTKDEINATLAAITPHVQAMADAAAEIDAILLSVEEAAKS